APTTSWPVREPSVLVRALFSTITPEPVTVWLPSNSSEPPPSARLPRLTVPSSARPLLTRTATSPTSKKPSSATPSRCPPLVPRNRRVPSSRAARRVGPADRRQQRPVLQRLQQRPTARPEGPAGRTVGSRAQRRSFPAQHVVP